MSIVSVRVGSLNVCCMQFATLHTDLSGNCRAALEMNDLPSGCLGHVIQLCGLSETDPEPYDYLYKTVRENSPWWVKNCVSSMTLEMKCTCGVTAAGQGGLHSDWCDL
jgi:hypothetical protein